MFTQSPNLTRRDLLRKGATFTAAALLALAPLADARAEEVEGWAPFQGALDYVGQNKGRGIGIVIYEGEDGQYTPDQIGRGFVKWFRERGADAQYFYATGMGNPVTTVSLIISDEDVLGPFNVYDAMGNAPQALQHLKFTRINRENGYDVSQN